MLYSTKFLFWALFSILLVHFMALSFNIYSSIWWFDIPMHFMGGAWVALLFFRIFIDIIDKKSLYSLFEISKLVILAIAFAVMIGVFWEFFEFIASRIFNMYLQGDLIDTMTDLLMDTIGGLFSGVIGALLLKKELSDKA